jgi:hypothetical protein
MGDLTSLRFLAGSAFSSAESVFISTVSEMVVATGAF